jgi:hypothetical protein
VSVLLGAFTTGALPLFLGPILGILCVLALAHLGNHASPEDRFRIRMARAIGRSAACSQVNVGLGFHVAHGNQ